MNTGEVIVDANDELTEALIAELRERGRREGRYALYRRPQGRTRSSARRRGRQSRTSPTRRGSRSTSASARATLRRWRRPENLFENLFFKAERYDLSKVGRLKLNHKFDLDFPLDTPSFTRGTSSRPCGTWSS